MDERSCQLLEAALSYAKRGWLVLPLHNPVGTGCSCVKTDCQSPGKHPRTKNGLKDATTDEKTIRQWWQTFPLANIGLATGAVSGFFVLDIDARHGGDDSLAGLREEFGPIPATVGAVTGAGEHIYFAHPGGLIQNSAGKLGEGIDVRGDGGYVVAPPSLHPSGRQYTWEGSSDPNEVPLAQPPAWLINQLRSSPLRRVHAADDADQTIPQGSRNIFLTSMAGTMRRRGFPKSSILAALLDVNDTLCNPPLDPVEVRIIAWSVGRYSPSDPVVARVLTSIDEWPQLPEAALYGLVGDVVRAIDPFTEADQAAILAHFLVFFGNCAGPSPHFRVGGDEHPAKLFAVIVGDSAVGRKGTSEGQIRRLFESVDYDWAKRRIIHGLASGEGLIRALQPTGTSADPRLLAIEPEMANVLKAMQRDGSILSGIIRQAWDRGDLQHQTRKDPIVVSGVHVSMISHVTRSELINTMDSGQSSNGFANRFLWFLVRQSKMLPDAPSVPDTVLQDLARRTSIALDTARRTFEVRRNDDAVKLWRTLYPKLREPKKGLLGLVTSRAPVQVLRLALTYALLDSATEVAPWHLEAAMALWEFSSLCAARIFGTRLGNPIAQRMLEELLETEGGEMTRLELYEALGRNVPSLAFENAAILLQESGYLTRHRREKKPGEPGRRSEVFKLAI